MTPHETGATAPPPRTFGPQGPTLGDLSDAYLQDYQVRQFRSQSTARGRIAHLTACFGRDARAAALTTYQIRQYQLARRAAGAATGTINRETSALHRMCTLAVHWGWLDTVPGFPDRLRENLPRQGFFEHPEYLAVRAHLPAPWQDILDLAYYSGWRKNEILGLTWDELDEAGGVIRLSPARSKTLVGRILPMSQPIAEALARRRARRDPDSPLVFHRDGIPIRRWRTAWRTACQAAGVPTRFLHDCRRTAARTLIRASVPERVAMLLTGHKTRAIFDRYNIINEQELLEAGISWSPIWRSTHRRRPVGARTRPARAPRRPSASCDAPPRKGARGGHRARRGWTRSDATVTSPSRNVSANGSATCVTRWRVPSRQKTTDERPLNGRFAADERFVVALARRDPNSLRVFHRNGIPILRWRTAWRTACQAAGVPTRFLHDCRRTAARNPPAPDVRRHATLPQSWIQRENWEFETHRWDRSGIVRGFWGWRGSGS